jgi:hypothetical protein
MAELARRHPDRHARHRRALASSRVRALLVVEITTAPGGAAGCGRRHPRADPADARSQPPLGRAPHPRRVAEARPRVSQTSAEVSGASRQAPVAGVAHVPFQSRLPTRLGRLLHGLHRHVSGVVCVRDVVARPTADHPPERHGIRPRRGQDNSSAKRGRGTRRRDSSSATAMESTARRFSVSRRPWTSTKR